MRLKNQQYVDFVDYGKPADREAEQLEAELAEQQRDAIAPGTIGDPSDPLDDLPPDWGEPKPNAHARTSANWHEISLDALWQRVNDPTRWPTPQSTIEAIMYRVRDRGLLAALKEPANVERLSRCDQAAKAQIDQRIDTLRQKGLLK